MKPTIRKLNKLAELSLQNALLGLDDTTVNKIIEGLRSVDRQLQGELGSKKPLKGASKLVEEICEDLEIGAAR